MVCTVHVGSYAVRLHTPALVHEAKACMEAVKRML